MISWNGFRNTSSKLVNLKRDCTLLNLTARSGMVNKNMAKVQRLKAATKKAFKATSEVCFTNFWGTSGGVTRALKCCYFFLIFVSFSIFVQAHTALSLARAFSAVAVQFELQLAPRWQQQQARAVWSWGGEVERDEERHLNLINPLFFYSPLVSVSS